MCTVLRISDDDHRPEQLWAVMRTFLSPGRLHVCVKVRVVTVESTMSSWKSYQCHWSGSLVLLSVNVTCCPAYGCCCSGYPGSSPNGPHVKSATGAAVWVHGPRTTICCAVWFDPLQLVAVS